MLGEHILETLENYLLFLLMNESINQVFQERLTRHQNILNAHEILKKYYSQFIIYSTMF